MCCCFSSGGMHCACLEKKKGGNREFFPKFGFWFEIKEDEQHFGAGDENQHTQIFQNMVRIQERSFEEGKVREKKSREKIPPKFRNQEQKQEPCSL